MFDHRLRFGTFIAPHHLPDINPLLQLERDLELVEWLDRLGFDEAWFGEHHSAGWEISASPELMIANLAARTKHIRLGTGVVSLPYHHPLMVADRIRQLDYLTRGRTMFGMGPGALPSDAQMMGVPTAKVRDRMDEAIAVLVRLLRGETVSCETEWFTLKEACLQLPPYAEAGVEMAVASMISPTGARAAGRFGLSLLSLGATSTGAFNALASNWAIAEEMAREFGTRVDRSGWRLVGPVHVAETREQARRDVAFGLTRWIDYMDKVAALPLAPPPGVDPIDFMVDTGFAVIGTPEDCVAQMVRLHKQSGGFGCFLNLAHPWAPWAATQRSYELIAEYVIPKVNNLCGPRLASEDWVRRNHAAFKSDLSAAVGARIARHAAEKGAEKLSPDLLAMFK
jgi:limonene 1,2-monooxygenase